MRALLVLCVALSLGAGAGEAQGVPFVTAELERLSVEEDGPADRVGGRAAIGMRSDRGYVQLAAGWFPGHDEEPRWGTIRLEGGPRLAGDRWSVGGMAGLVTFHVAAPPRASAPWDFSSVGTVAPLQLREGWSSGATVGAAAALHLTPSLEMGAGYRLTGLLLGVNRSHVLRGANLTITHAFR